MLPAPSDKLQYLVGRYERFVGARPLKPYDDLTCAFLADLSECLLSGDIRRYPDVASFAYWCRRANVARLRAAFENDEARLGLGVVFHVTPANVPINFAFSYAFSLLAGNSSVVRAPTKPFPQTAIVCNALQQLFSHPKHQTVADMTVFARYERDDGITAAFSAVCNARVVWGGDQTIKSMRAILLPERSIEVVFADRYSACVIDGTALVHARGQAIEKLAQDFYNDTYVLDQNACSSPHLVVWLGKGEAIEKAKEKFWDHVYDLAVSRYELQPISAVDKYTLMCRNAIDVPAAVSTKDHGNYVYRVALDSLPKNVDTLRGQCGYFYEYTTDHIDELAAVINARYQTLTYFGCDNSQLLDFVMRNRLTGIDRIVPVGLALDIGIKWDGYDIVRTLSRVIEVR